MTSIRGIGEKTAATFLIEMGGEIKSFETHIKLIATAGLDPFVYQSGQYEGMEGSRREATGISEE